MPDFLVIGGDRFGEYHARQLRGRFGAAAVRLLEGDCLPALRAWVAGARPEDQLVPGPLMPHLLRDWLGGELGAVVEPAPRGWGLPYEAEGVDGALYLSAAGWRCPATCIEPGHCPALHAPRDWDLGDIIEARAVALGHGPAVFRCHHYAAGVGTVPVAALRAALSLADSTVLVATSSRCHAAVGILRRADPGKLSTGL